MNTYEIPRNYKGEGRILYIFSTKGLIYTVVGLAIGLIFYFIFKIYFINNSQNFLNCNEILRWI